MISGVRILRAMLFLCLACAPTSPIVRAQTSPISSQQDEDKLLKKDRWTIALAGASAGLSLIGAFLSFMYFRKNVKLSKQLADRTVTVESQKLLLEINKQYLSDPKLFAIYKDYPGRDQLLKDPEFLNKIKALGYLKLNVFEIVFAALPTEGSSYKTWEAYFEDSLNRCPVLVDELVVQRGIYDTHLLDAYDRWFKKQPKAPRYKPF